MTVKGLFLGLMEAMMTFDAWIALVDQALIQKIGLTSNDLHDTPWRAWFADNMSPTEAVNLVTDDEA